MSKEKSPAFQFYPKEFLTDGNVAAMSLQECGAYIRLLSLCWQEESLPTDPQRLANMVGVPLETFTPLWPGLSMCFIEIDGRLRHPRLDAERQKQLNYRQQQSLKGQASAAAKISHPSTGGRPDANRKTTAVQPSSQPEDNRGSTDAQPEDKPELKSPISDLRSPNTKKRESERADAPPGTHTGELSGTDDLDLAKRAAHFCDNYAALYKQYRHGAFYHPSRRGGRDDDYQRAVSLCATFPSDRLRDLVVVFLNSDDPYILKSDRGMAVFERKVSWCDDMLRQTEAQQRGKFPRSA